MRYNRRIFLYIGILVLVLCIFLFVRYAHNPANTVIQNQLPSNTDTSNTQGSTNPQNPTGTTLLLSDGTNIPVADFKHDASTKKDPNNDGYYAISGGLTPSPSSVPFSIIYNDANQSFNVTLLREPLAQVRQQAEAYLMQKLNINQATMCRLTYVVGVPSSVNNFYAGKNLGFSFCPGATSL